MVAGIPASFCPAPPHNLGFVDVPRNEYYYRDINKKGVAFEDGYLMSKNGIQTFYKNFTEDELKKQIEAIGFSFSEKVNLDHRVSLIYKNDM